MVAFAGHCMGQVDPAPSWVGSARGVTGRSGNATRPEGRSRADQKPQDGAFLLSQNYISFPRILYFMTSFKSKDFNLN